MKKSILVLLMLISPTVAAQAPGDNIRKIAYDQAVEAITLAGDRIRTCEAKEDRKIPKESMPKLALSDQEWMRALIFLGMRAADLCYGDAYSHALKYFMRYQSVEEHFTQKVIDQITMPDKDIVTLYALIGGNSVGRIEGEIIYQAINAAAREKLESLNILKHPFKAINVELNK